MSPAVPAVVTPSPLELPGIEPYYVSYAETETKDPAELRANFDKQLASGKPISNSLWLGYLSAALSLSDQELFSYFMSHQAAVTGADLKLIQADLLVGAALAKDTAMLEWLTTDAQWQTIGFDPNAKPARVYDSYCPSCTQNYSTVLMEATAKGAPTGNLDWLLQHGADPSRQDEYGNTVLNSAVATYKPEYVDFFLLKGLGLNPDKSNPPVLTAIHYQSLEMLKHLVDKGASLAIQYQPVNPYEFGLLDPTFLQTDKISPLDLAVMETPSKEFVDYLIEKGETPDKPENALALECFLDSYNLMDSIYDGEPDLLKRLLSYKPDVNFRDAGGHTPVMVFVRRQNYLEPARRRELLDQLVAAGAELKVADTDGKTLLMYAAETGDLGVAQSVLFKGLGSEIAREDNAGRNVLYYANQSGNNDMKRYFESIPRPPQP